MKERLQRLVKCIQEANVPLDPVLNQVFLDAAERVAKRELSHQVETILMMGMPEHVLETYVLRAELERRRRENARGE